MEQEKVYTFTRHSRDDYAGMAGIYDLATSWAMRSMRKAIVSRVGGPGRLVLDDCGGTGALAEILGESGARGLVVDGSPAMLRAGLESRGGCCGFVLGEAQRLPLADASIDACVLSFALHENTWESAVEMVREGARVVKPTGELVALDYVQPRSPGQWVARLGADVVERAAGRRHYRHYRRFLRAGGLAALLDAAGLDARVEQTFYLGAVGLAVARVPARG
jgi:ubiquinone/menaquinone biosynthesis C-methylase UbiE